MLNKWGDWLGDRLDRRSLIFIISGLVLVGLYFLHLSEARLSPDEISAIGSSASLHGIWNNPLNGPHAVLLYLLQHFGHHSAAIMRMVSAGFGLIFVACFYKIAKYWCGSFIAWLGTIFFAATPLLVLASRSASAAVMVLWPLTAIAAYMKFVRSKDRLYLRFLLLVVLAAAAVYMPGGPIFIILAAFYVIQTVRKYIKGLDGFKTALAAAIFLAIIFPVIWASIHEVNIAKQLFLIPASFSGITNFLKEIGWALSSYVWRSGTHHYLQIGHLAVLNAAQIIIGAFGFFAMWGRARAKLKILAATFALAVIASALNRNYLLLLLGLPAVGIVVATGLRYLHLEWTSIFPRNPLPRGLAIIILITILALQIVWAFRYCLAAWPHAF